jgi:hypothetical protein
MRKSCSEACRSTSEGSSGSCARETSIAATYADVGQVWCEGTPPWFVHHVFSVLTCCKPSASSNSRSSSDMAIVLRQSASRTALVRRSRPLLYRLPLHQVDATRWLVQPDDARLGVRVAGRLRQLAIAVITALVPSIGIGASSPGMSRKSRAVDQHQCRRARQRTRVAIL